MFVKECKNLLKSSKILRGPFKSPHLFFSFRHLLATPYFFLRKTICSACLDSFQVRKKYFSVLNSCTLTARDWVPFSKNKKKGTFFYW
jgi:hypothetical protein